MADNRDALPHEVDHNGRRWVVGPGLQAIARAPRCGVKTRQGHLCRQVVTAPGKRCRRHGGLSTGAKTLEGKRRQRCANLKHGKRSVVWKRAEMMADLVAERVANSSWGDDEDAREALAGEILAASLGSEILIQELMEDLALAKKRTP